VSGSSSCSATARSNSVASPNVRSSTGTPVARRSPRSVRAACSIRLRADSMRIRISPRCSSPDRPPQRLDLVEAAPPSSG